VPRFNISPPCLRKKNEIEYRFQHNMDKWGEIGRPQVLKHSMRSNDSTRDGTHNLLFRGPAGRHVLIYVFRKGTQCTANMMFS
jgi:hypothetical protein